LLCKSLFCNLSLSKAVNLILSSIFFKSYFKQIFVYIAEGGEDSQEKEERSYGSLMMERLTGSEEGRIDHMLQVRCLPI
jgi:hypothetical protein